MEAYKEELNKLKGKFDEDDLRIGNKLIDIYGSVLQGHELSEYILKESPNNVDKTYAIYNKTMSDFWERLLNLSEEDKKIYFNAVYQYRRFIGTDYI